MNHHTCGQSGTKLLTVEDKTFYTGKKVRKNIDRNNTFYLLYVINEIISTNTDIYLQLLTVLLLTCFRTIKINKIKIRSEKGHRARFCL